MKKMLNLGHGFVGAILKKGLLSAVLFVIVPTSVAVAEPSMGMLGSLAVTNAASTVAVPMVKTPKQEQFVATITAYTSRAAETDMDPYISADGHYVYDGLIACSREYPFGTKVIVDGRTYRCGDRMAQKNDHALNLSMSQPKFDIWMSDLAMAKQWGRRTKEVTILYN